MINILKHWKLILIAILLIIASVFYYKWDYERGERKRQEKNVSELTKNLYQSNIDLILTRKEFKESQTAWKAEMETAMKKAGLNLKEVTEVYQMEISYRDSVIRIAKMGKPEPIKEPISNNPTQPKTDSKTRYKVSFEQADSCFSVSGNVFSTDPYPQVQITNKSYENIGDLFATRERFCGFLWWKKPSKYVAVSKCGETKYKHIKFK